MTSPILMEAVALVEVLTSGAGRVWGAARGAARGADRGDLTVLARSANDRAAAGRPVPVRIRLAAGPPREVGTASRFRVVADSPGRVRLVADLELDPEHLASIRRRRLVSIGRGRWDDRRLQAVEEVALGDRPLGGTFGPPLSLPRPPIPTSG